MPSYKRIDEDIGDEKHYLIMWGNWGYGSISLSLATEVCDFNTEQERDAIFARLIDMHEQVCDICHRAYPLLERLDHTEDEEQYRVSCYGCNMMTFTCQSPGDALDIWDKTHPGRI